MRTDIGQTIHLKDYKAPEYDIKSVHLDVTLDDKDTVVVANIEFCQNENTPLGKPLILDGDELVLKSVKIDGKLLEADAFDSNPQSLTLKTPPKTPFKLTLETQLDPQANTKLMGLYRSNGVYCTQCEAEGFRRITYFLDRPDVLTTYTTRIVADKASVPILLGNGNKTDEGDLADGKHFAIWHDPHPKPSYLFALVGGCLDAVSDQFITMSGRRVALNVYVEKGKGNRAGFALWALKNAMRWDEDTYGCEYDLDVFNIVAVSDFNMGAMENKGLNIFNDQFILADPQTATDGNYHLIDSIIAHEYFHNWTGNRITCRDWFQLCLKEGLTVFRDQEYSEDQGSKTVSRIQEVLTVKSAQFQEDASPLAHPVRPDAYSEINNFYTATVYRKGAEVIRMLKTILGRVGFFKGIHLYFDRHDGTAATIEEFITCFEDANNADLSQFFLWYNQAGTPKVTVEQSYDNTTNSLTLKLKQKTEPTPGQAVKKPFHIPLRFGLVGRDGQDISFHVDGGCPVTGGIIHLNQNEAVLTFSNLASRPVVSIGRDFSAPINLEMNVSLSEQKFLALFDSDYFNRWQSVQNIMMDHLINASQQEQAKPEIASNFLELLYNLAQQQNLDPHYRATLLSLPSPNIIANAIGTNINHEKILTAHKNLQEALGKKLAPELPRLLETLKISDSYKPSAEQVGKRALSATLLYLGCAAGDAYALKFCQTQYYEADNMSARLNAINCYLQNGTDEKIRDKMLQDFYDKANGDPLVHDKWFSIQAVNPDPNALIHVITLMAHPAFQIDNPNRVRALIGGFVMNNPMGFHRIDGKGYEFLARIGVEIDKKNPQLAARLLTAFSTWETLEPSRRKLAKAALESIIERDELSTDVKDIVSRTLGI